MDRSIYVSMTGAAETMRAQALHSNNLANVTTPGFKAELQQFRSIPVYGDVFPSRVFAAAEAPGNDFTPGPMIQTGNDLDIAINGNGFFLVRTPEGEQGLTRRGDLQINENGFLVNGAGHFIQGGGDINVGEAKSISIGTGGEVNILTNLAEPTNVTVAATLTLVNPDVSNLKKAENGLFVNKDGAAFDGDEGLKVASGALEQSNVNSVGELIDILILARTYELDVKMMETAKQNDESSARILNIS